MLLQCLLFFVVLILGSQQGIKEVDGELHCSSQLLLNLGDKLCKSRQVQKNITEAIEVLSHCLPGCVLL